MRYCSAGLNSMSNLFGYSDADFAAVTDERKSTNGWSFPIGRGAASWCNKRKSLLSQSTVEVEFMELSFETREVI